MTFIFMLTVSTTGGTLICTSLYFLVCTYPLFAVLRENIGTLISTLLSQERQRLVVRLSYMVILFGESIQGREGLMLDMNSLNMLKVCFHSNELAK